MAILRLARENSGSETAVKVLAVLTQDITIHNGKVLLSQFGDKALSATKMSLFVSQGILSESRIIGERNVWLVDLDESLLITYAHEKEGRELIDKLYLCGDWYEAFPTTNFMVYNLKHLDKAAADMRNFLLIGALPSMGLTDEEKTKLDCILRDGEIDIVASLDLDKVDLGDDN